MITEKPITTGVIYNKRYHHLGCICFLLSSFISVNMRAWMNILVFVSMFTLIPKI